ncbi:MAG: hypothetical protein RJQ03_04010 [Miltoncostaeaceae bacterium]
MEREEREFSLSIDALSGDTGHLWGIYGPDPHRRNPYMLRKRGVGIGGRLVVLVAPLPPYPPRAVGPGMSSGAGREATPDDPRGVGFDSSSTDKGRGIELDYRPRVAEHAAALVAERLPLVVPDATGEFNDWRVAGPVLVVRATDTLLAIHSLPPPAGFTAAEVLTRTLFEQVATFAWLAAEPDVRLPLWEASEYREREKLRNRIEDLRKRESYRGAINAAFPEPAIVDERWEETRRLARGPTMPGLLERCIQADNAWRSVIPGLAEHPLALHYNVVYSSFSMATHAGLASTFKHARFASGGTGVEIGGPYFHPKDQGPWGVALVVHLTMLLVAAQALGWPDAHKVYGVFSAA